MISPSSIGGTLALILAFFEFRFPEVPYEVLSMLGGTTTPLSMLIIGSSLAAIPLKEVFKGWRNYAFSVIRLVVVPAIVYLALFKFIENPTILGVLVVSVSTDNIALNLSYLTQIATVIVFLVILVVGFFAVITSIPFPAFIFDKLVYIFIISPAFKELLLVKFIPTE